ncbi:MAG: PAS domain-containing protein [Silicimonas sp.]|jgi:hypothetical protein|nr:PAS domain-containing protein [Silicimonas sp.]
MGTGNDQPRGGNVFEFQAASPVSAKIDRIESYWNSIRANRLVPSRCEVDPRGLEGALGHAFILERIAGGLARFRIAGSHLTDLAGLEMRQMPLSVLFAPGSRDQLSEALYSVFDDPAVIRMAVASPAGFGRERLEGELILLPLRSDLGDIDRVLGGLVLHGEIGRAPRRVEILGQTRRSMTGYAGPAHVHPPSSQAGPVEPSRPTRTRTPEQPKGRRHLRLVVTND